MTQRIVKRRSGISKNQKSCLENPLPYLPGINILSPMLYIRVFRYGSIWVQNEGR